MSRANTYIDGYILVNVHKVTEKKRSESTEPNHVAVGSCPVE
jgi:hypothetical protein